jgi:hypothetical protein
MAPKPDHSAGCASIAATLNTALEGGTLDADALALACKVSKVDFAIAVQAMANIGLIAFKKDKLVLGPLGKALVVSAYIG